jgi:hypothetical protein
MAGRPRLFSCVMALVMIPIVFLFFYPVDIFKSPFG